jgi:hypothetical protein
MINLKTFGSMPEWLMGADCKSAGSSYAGSNPARPIFLKIFILSFVFLRILSFLLGNTEHTHTL